MFKNCYYYQMYEAFIHKMLYYMNINEDYQEVNLLYQY